MKDQDINKNQIFHFLFDSSSEGIVITDQTGVIIKSNPKANEIFGTPNNENVGANIIDFVDVSDLEKVTLAFEKILKSIPVQDIYFLLVKKNRERFYGEIKSTVVKNKKLNASFVVLRIRDITTENKYLENLLRISEEQYQDHAMMLEKHVESRTIELRNAISEQESFCYTVSHDLRAPLRAINGYSNILMEDHGSHLDKEGKRYLQLISDNTLKLGQLVDDLLNFSKLGRKELLRINTSVKKIVENVIEELVQELNGRDIEILMDSLGDAYVDPSLITQVYMNLLSNAIKFTRPKKKAVIIIGSKKDKGRDVFYVKDNGVGFDMHYADKLYGVFQRLHRNDEFEGTGVGLAIVKRIIDKHGGQIWADSVLKKGTTFYFTFEKTADRSTFLGEYDEKLSD